MGKKPKQADDFDILGKLNMGSNMEIDINDPELMKELKGMGWDDDDMDLDPEMAELEKEIEDEEDFEIPKGREMTAEEIEKAQFDDDDLMDPELEKELEEAEGRENDPALQASIRIDTLTKQIEAAKANAIREKQNGDKDKALEHLKAMKSLQAELDSTQKLLTIHQITQKPKPDGQPPEDFDFTSIVSLSVLEHEKDSATKRKKRDVVETIEMQIDILTNNINLGLLSQEDYIQSLESKIQEYSSLTTGPHSKFYSKHVELMKQELEEAAQQEEEEDEEEEAQGLPESSPSVPSVPASNPSSSPPVPVQAPMPSPKIEDNHEDLMKNIKYKTVFESFDEGKLAFQYLKNIGRSDLAEKIIDRLETWQKILQVYKQGKEIKSEIKPLSPMDLVGTTEEERRKEFQRLLQFTAEQAAKSKEKALASLKMKDKEQAAVYKREMLLHEQKAQIMEVAMKNPWQPPPKVSFKSIVKSVQVLQEDLEPGVLEITYGKASGFSDGEDYFVTYSLVAGDTLTGATERFSKVNTKGFNHTFCVKVELRNFASLFKKHIIFEVFEYHRIRSNKSQGTFNIKLEQLAKTSKFTTTVQLNRKGPTFEVTFRIHKSLQTPELKQVTENLEVIEDLLPPFKTIDGAITQRKPDPATPSTSSSQSAPPSSSKASSPPEESKQENINFDDIGQDEYDDPNVIRNLVSFEVLELEIEKLKNIIIELRSNGQSADKFMNLQREMMRNKSIIEAQVGNGVITPDQYKEVLISQVAHDTKLAAFYKQRNKRQHLETVINRIKIMRKEIEELNNAE